MRGWICALFIVLAAALPAPGQNVRVFETYADQSRLLAERSPGLAFAPGPPAGSPAFTIAVDGRTTYQQMDGVGASLTDSAAWVLSNTLTGSERDALMLSLFDPNAGIGIGLLRQPMGASDFSASGNYSYDDVPAGESDPDLARFSIAHDQTYLIPLLRQALSINPSLKVHALPWSPPAWMKTTGSMNDGYVVTADFPSLAQYFTRFIGAYQLQGIPIYAVSMQNEPLYRTSSYPSAYVASSDQANFIGNYLGPALARAGLGCVRIFGYEHNWDNPQYPEALLADSAAYGYLAGSAFHCYAGDVSAQSQVKQAYQAKDIWFTECSGTVGSSFAGDLVWNAEKLLIGATRNWARGVTLWNLALDQNSGPQNGGCSKCRGVVTVDSSVSPARITRNVEYYVLGHLGKFVQPGAYRIDSNTYGSGSLEDVAFRNPDGSIVVLVLNAASGSLTFAVTWNGSSFTDTLPAGAVATYEWTVPAPTPPARFRRVAPCRIADTRNPNGAFGGPMLEGGSHRSFPIPEGACDIPSSASAYSVNLTVVPPDPLGYLTAWPAGLAAPLDSTLDSFEGRIVASAAIVPAGANGAIDIYATDTTHLVIDIDGYFESSAAAMPLLYALTPCRTAHPRDPAGQARDIPLTALSVNATVVRAAAGGAANVWATNATVCAIEREKLRAGR